MNSLSIQNNKTKYYKLYMKYKEEYLSLKKQIGGQVIIDLMGDDYLGDNALEEIVIKVINVSGDDIKYKKVIRVNVGDEKGTVYTKDYESGNINRHGVNRGEIERLLKDIDNVWDLPNPRTNGYLRSRFLLSIIHGDNQWPNGRADRRTSRLSKSDDIDEVYDSAITNVLSFE